VIEELAAEEPSKPSKDKPVKKKEEKKRAADRSGRAPGEEGEEDCGAGGEAQADGKAEETNS
jgi:hypothetical protein